METVQPPSGDTHTPREMEVGISCTRGGRLALAYVACFVFVFSLEAFLFSACISNRRFSGCSCRQNAGITMKINESSQLTSTPQGEARDRNSHPDVSFLYFFFRTYFLRICFVCVYDLKHADIARSTERPLYNDAG